MRGDCLNQACAIDRLGQMAVAARGQATLGIALHGVGRQGQDRTGVAAVAQGARRLVAVHFRHVDVHEDHVERLSPGPLDGDPAIVGHLDVGAGFAEERADETRLSRPSSASKMRTPVQVFRRRWRRGRLGQFPRRLGRALDHRMPCRSPVGTVKVKVLPSPQHALGRQRAAKQLGNVAGDGQSQSRPAEFSRDRVVGLGEGLEQPRQDFRGDADARVDHVEADRRLTISPIRGARRPRSARRRVP